MNDFWSKPDVKRGNLIHQNSCHLPPAFPLPFNHLYQRDLCRRHKEPSKCIDHCEKDLRQIRIFLINQRNIRWCGGIILEWFIQHFRITLLFNDINPDKDFCSFDCVNIWGSYENISLKLARVNFSSILIFCN